MESDVPVSGSEEWQDGPEDRMYPLVLPLEYRVYGVGVSDTDEVCQTGSGRTLKMSSGRVIFESDRTLRVGLDGELSIAWPASLSKSVGLTLQVKGRIVRTDQNRAEFATKRYEFRTRRCKPGALNG